MTRRRTTSSSGSSPQSRSAEARRCPTCGRAAALVSVTPRPLLGGVTTYCRWDDCDYARVRALDTAKDTFPRIPAGSGGMATEAYMDWYG